MRTLGFVARLFIVIVALTATSGMGLAQSSYPDRPIRLVVGFPPGGINDIVARLVGQKLSISLKQPVVVENRAGAGGTMGADYVAKAAPDGYTLLLGSVSNLAMAVSQYKSLPYNPSKDFTPVALVGASPNVLVVHPNFSAKSVKELIALAQEKPGTINYASAGTGSSNHLTAELFKSMAKIDLVHVPYRGDMLATTDVVGGQVPVMFSTLPVALPHITGGTLRPLAVSSATRTALAPGIPTVAESGGLSEFAVSVWVGIVAPAGTPRSIVEMLNTEIQAAVQAPDVRESLAKNAVEPAATGSPADFGAYIAAEIAKWSDVAKAANIARN